MEQDGKTSLPPSASAPLRMFCKTCNREATNLCDDEEHEVMSLRRARAQDAGLLLAALEQAEQGLDKLGEVLGNCLEQERAGLAAARTRLQEAMGASSDVWEQAKQSADPTALSRSAAQLADELLDPAVSCTVAVRRGPTVSWTADLRPADHADARLLLGRLACSGGLRVHCTPDGQARTPDGPPPKKPRGRPRLKPLRSPPKKTVGSTPKKPRGRPPKTPGGSSPKKPVESSPKKPVAHPSKKPVESLFQTPVGSSLEDPDGSSPKKPVGSWIKKPDERSPKKPVGSSLEEPDGSSPKRPGESSTEELAARSPKRFTMKEMSPCVSCKEIPLC